MGLFDFIVRKMTPPSVEARYQVVIYNFLKFVPNIKVNIVFNEKVLLTSPKVEEEEDEEVTMELFQPYSSTIPEQRKTLYVTVHTSFEGREVNINLSYKESTAQLEIFNSIIHTVRMELHKVEEKVKHYKKIREEIDSTIQQKLSKEQECALAAYLCKLTNSQTETCYFFCYLFGVKYCDIALLEGQLWNPKNPVFNTLITVRNKWAIDTFISYCCQSEKFQDNNTNKKEFTNILLEWGFTKKEIELRINDTEIQDPPKFKNHIYSSFYEKLHGTGNIEEKKVKESSAPSDNFDKIKKQLLENLKRQGIAIDEEEIQRTQNSLNLYDGSKDYEINTLSLEQKCALLLAVERIGRDSTISDKKEEVNKVIKDFSTLLKLYDIPKQTLISILNTQTAQDKYIETIKTIHKDGPFIQFLDACHELQDIGDDNTFITYTFDNLLKSIGFSQECIDAIHHGKYIFRFENNND